MSIRLRLALSFTLVAVALFSLGSWAFVSSLSGSMLSTIDAQLATQAGQASLYVTPPASAASSGDHRAEVPEYVVQLVDATGQVRASSSEAEGEPILSATQMARARQGRITVTVGKGGDEIRVLAESFPAHRGWVVVTGASLTTYHATVGRAEMALVIAGAIFAVAVAGGSFALGTAALRPVERLRREVAQLARRDTPGSVAVPGTHDEIAALAETMNVLLTTIHSALERERSLIADVSHELRTPFAVLQGELELASRPGRSLQELRDAVMRASDEAGRLARLANDLLFLSRSDQGHLGVDRRPTDIGELLSASARPGAGPGSAGYVPCRVDAPEGLVWAVDPVRVRQALDNLIANALRFAPPGSEITITARQQGPDLVVSVADAGPGFPVEFLPHAFERFRRPDASRSRSEGGAGLGLAIVSAIAAAHGGSATAANRPGGGAVVTLQLPARAGHPLDARALDGRDSRQPAAR